MSENELMVKKDTNKQSKKTQSIRCRIKEVIFSNNHTNRVNCNSIGSSSSPVNIG